PGAADEDRARGERRRRRRGDRRARRLEGSRQEQTGRTPPTGGRPGPQRRGAELRQVETRRRDRAGAQARRADLDHRPRYAGRDGLPEAAGLEVHRAARGARRAGAAPGARAVDGRPLLQGRFRVGVAAGVQRPRLAPRSREQEAGDHAVVDDGRGRVHRRRRAPLGYLVPEARMRWALVLAVAAAALFASGASAATVECAGIPTCIDVPGPWVAVPASGEAKFLLDCPQRRGVVGGVDALASSRHIHVTFEGLLGGPVAPGRTTTRYAFFRAVSGNHREGLFEPRI